MTTVTTTESPYLTTEEVAKRWRLKERVVREEINRGNLLAFKVGGQWRITPEAVETYEQSRLNVQPVAQRTRRPRKRRA